MAVLEGAAGARVAFNSGQSIGRKTSGHCREKGRRKKERERESEETAAFGRGLATKELLRLRSFSNAVVIYSYGSSCRAAKPHAHGSVASVSRRGGGWEKEREGEEGAAGNKKAPQGTPTGQPTRSKGKDTSGSRVRARSSGRVRSFG